MLIFRAPARCFGFRTVCKVYALWNVVFSPAFGLPTADRSEEAAPAENQEEHEFFHSSVTFFRVLQDRQTRLGVNLPGRFVFYQFSEAFHKYSDALPRAVIVGQWDIEFSGGACCIEEMQEYDGRLGKQLMRGSYTGYCLPIGPHICFVTKGAYEESPKFYVMESVYRDPKTQQTMIMSGYMLKGSRMYEFFRSPVYAVRVPQDKAVECNIFRCEEIPPSVMHELDALSNR